MKAPLSAEKGQKTPTSKEHEDKGGSQTACAKHFTTKDTPGACRFRTKVTCSGITPSGRGKEKPENAILLEEMTEREPQLLRPRTAIASATRHFRNRVPAPTRPVPGWTTCPPTQRSRNRPKGSKGRQCNSTETESDLRNRDDLQPLESRSAVVSTLQP